MSPIDIEFEIGLLEESFETRLATLPSDACPLSDRLVTRIGIRPNSEPRWVSQFSPLTLLYPLLQAEGFDDIDIESARSATLAHLFILIYAFLDDRRTDGQIVLDQDEKLFAKRMLSEGLVLLEEIHSNSTSAVCWIRKLSYDYRYLSVERYPLETYDSGNTMSIKLKQIVAGKASMGALSVMALSSSRISDAKAISAIMSAYDSLVVGLQWADDTEDWRDDLRRNDENLLLNMLASVSFDPYEQRNGRIGFLRTGCAIVRHCIFGRAIGEAGILLNRAANEQKNLKCYTLERLIRQVINTIASAEDRLVSRAASDVIRHLLQPKVG